MLPGMGGFEAVIIALLALVIVGPKDLPVLMRKLARWVNKVRGMAAEFRMSFDELARQSELDELRREVEALRRGDPFQPIRTELDPINHEINAGLSDHPSSGANDSEHAAYESAVAEANGDAAPADPYTPSFESAPPPAPTPALPEAAASAAGAGESEPAAPAAAAESPAPAAKRTRRKAVAGGEA